MLYVIAENNNEPFET
ncbi:Protein of unknown function [Bacillus wiedmannii]|uniref:Uncharacterized protein n=1 Tax=Bacillus wiedmannii TaxID=1890302 RepID=A0A1C4G5Q4_9BACI|nr:Protein of unknown function [Bacillus wiedmannii]SCC63482.1 Protein of unknown function [Bacillus wiedmannii]